MIISCHTILPWYLLFEKKKNLMNSVFELLYLFMCSISFSDYLSYFCTPSTVKWLPNKWLQNEQET